MKARKGDHPAAVAVSGILHIIDSVKGNPTPETLRDLRTLAVDALRVLQEPDPRLQRLLTAVLVFVQCTEAETKIVNGRHIDRFVIIDPSGFRWSAVNIHLAYDALAL